MILCFALIHPRQRAILFVTGEKQKNEAYGTIYICLSYRFSLSNIIISMGEDMSSFTELEGAKHTYHI